MSRSARARAVVVVALVALATTTVGCQRPAPRAPDTTAVVDAGVTTTTTTTTTTTPATTTTTCTGPDVDGRPRAPARPLRGFGRDGCRLHGWSGVTARMVTSQQQLHEALCAEGATVDGDVDFENEAVLVVHRGEGDHVRMIVEGDDGAFVVVADGEGDVPCRGVPPIGGVEAFAVARGKRAGHDVAVRHCVTSSNVKHGPCLAP